MKNVLKSLMLIVMVSILFTSCNEQKKELKEFAEKFNNECPIPMGDIGSVNSVSFDGETVELKFTSNEAFAPISSLSAHPQEIKEAMSIALTKESSKILIDKIIAADAKLRTVFVGNQTGQRAEFTITSQELKESVSKFSNMNDKQKLIVNMVIGSKIKLPIAIDEITKLVGLSLTPNALVYKYEINDVETGQELDSSINFMKYITMSQMAHSMKGGMMGDRNRQFYQALIDCNQGLEYEYYELKTSKRASFRISISEMRDVLNGEYDNQPTAEEWESLGNAIDELEQTLGDRDYVEVVDTVAVYDDYY